MKLIVPAAKPVNVIAKDLRTPKYRQRVVVSKVLWKRHDKHRKDVDAL